MAGIQSLINQRTGSRQGNPNPSYYSLAHSEYGTTGSASCNSMLGNGVASSCIYYDVTQGDMDVNCTRLEQLLYAIRHVLWRTFHFQLGVSARVQNANRLGLRDRNRDGECL